MSDTPHPVLTSTQEPFVPFPLPVQLRSGRADVVGTWHPARVTLPRFHSRAFPWPRGKPCLKPVLCKFSFLEKPSLLNKDPWAGGRPAPRVIGILSTTVLCEYYCEYSCIHRYEAGMKLFFFLGATNSWGQLPFQLHAEWLAVHSVYHSRFWEWLFSYQQTPNKSSFVLSQLDPAETREQYHAKARALYSVASRAHLCSWDLCWASLAARKKFITLPERRMPRCQQQPLVLPWSSSSSVSEFKTLQGS